MATVRERLNQWLRDAHAAERQAGSMLSGTAGRNSDYPEFSERLRQQAQTSERHAQMLEECLGRRDTSTSTIKDLTGQVTSFGQTISGLIFGDEVMKAALATATFARMLASSDRILVAAAKKEGDEPTMQACETLLGNNEEFARWAEGQLSSLTARYLEAETTAEREQEPAAG